MKIITMMILVCLISVNAFADTVYIPQNCKEIKSSTFSTGGGNKAVIYCKIHCKMDDGTDELFLAKKISTSGLFGVGRFTMPDSIKFVRSSKMKNKAKWE